MDNSAALDVVSFQYYFYTDSDQSSWRNTVFSTGAAAVWKFVAAKAMEPYCAVGRGNGNLSGN